MSNETVKMKQHLCSNHSNRKTNDTAFVCIQLQNGCYSLCISLAIVHVRRVSWGASYQDEDE